MKRIATTLAALGLAAGAVIGLASPAAAVGTAAPSVSTVGGTVTTQGLNTCKVTYVRTFRSNLAQCYIFPNPISCYYDKKVVKCTQY